MDGAFGRSHYRNGGMDEKCLSTLGYRPLDRMCVLAYTVASQRTQQEFLS